MEVGFGISATIMGGIFLLLMILMFFCNGKVIRTSQLKTILIVFGCALLAFSIFFVPDPSIRWDLLEHYKEVDALRGRSLSYAVQTSWYSGLYYLSMIYTFFMSRLSTYQLIPLIPIVIDYACFMYIFFDRFKSDNEERHIDIYKGAFVFIVWISTFGLKLAISGMRCVTACAIASLAIYIFCKGKTRFLWTVLLIIVAALIHSFSLVIVIVWIISKLKHKAIIPAIIIILDIICIRLLQNVSTFTSNTYISFSIKKMIRYWNRFSPEAVYNKSGFTFLVMYICMIIVVILMIIFIRKYGSSLINTVGVDRRILNYGEALSYFAVGMCFNYLFMERTMYLLSYCLVMILPCKYYKILESSTWAMVLLIIVLFIFYSNDIGTFIANYS